VTRKSARIAAMFEPHHGQKLSPHYAGYFELFNAGKFYEAHDVLEHIWLKDKHGANGNFYKGLIQLAGAFVHLQKNRLRPAAALLKLARANLENFPRAHEQLNLQTVRALIETWLADLESNNFEMNPLSEKNIPRLALEFSND
jgi:uncharacterized protein